MKYRRSKAENEERDKQRKKQIKQREARTGRRQHRGGCRELIAAGWWLKLSGGHSHTQQRWKEHKGRNGKNITVVCGLLFNPASDIYLPWPILNNIG